MNRRRKREAGGKLMLGNAVRLIATYSLNEQPEVRAKHYKEDVTMENQRSMLYY